MKNLISKQNKHLLWKDELGSDFILLKYAEVYRYSPDTLRLHIWSSKKLLQLQKIGVIFDVWNLDEPFTIGYVKVINLPKIIALGRFKRRPYVKGKWVKEKEEILAHRIFPYNPKALKKRKPKKGD